MRSFMKQFTVDFEAMKGKKDLYTMGLLSLVQTQGGKLATISQINEAYNLGKLSKKQAFDMRQAITRRLQNKRRYNSQK